MNFRIILLWFLLVVALLGILFFRAPSLGATAEEDTILFPWENPEEPTIWLALVYEKKRLTYYIFRNFLELIAFRKSHPGAILYFRNGETPNSVFIKLEENHDF